MTACSSPRSRVFVLSAFPTMSLRDPQCFTVRDPSQVGETRRAAVSLAQRLGFDEQRAGQVAITVTEAANNLIRHGRGGELLLHPVARDAVLGIELLAIDRGPGMRDPSTALRDGFSTGGTPGSGLGAIRRLASEFDLYSRADASHGQQTGTVLFWRHWNSTGVPRPTGDLEVGAVCLPKPGEDICGDAWTLVRDGDRLTIVVADGLGHGAAASEASRRATKWAEEHPDYDPVRLMDTMHGALRSTRGAAVAIVELRPRQQAAQIVGVGNISAMVLPPDGAPAGTTTRNLTSHNGTVGVEARRIQSFPVAWPQGATLLMHSDGLATSWQLSRYPGLTRHHPSVIAGVLYRDHRRVRDDVTVLVARQSAEVQGGRP